VLGLEGVLQWKTSPCWRRAPGTWRFRLRSAAFTTSPCRLHVRFLVARQPAPLRAQGVCQVRILRQCRLRQASGGSSFSADSCRVMHLGLDFTSSATTEADVQLSANTVQTTRWRKGKEMVIWCLSHGPHTWWSCAPAQPSCMAALA